MEKEDIKKILRGLSLGIAVVGSLILLVFTFMINDAIDKLEKTAVSNIEKAQGTLFEFENTLEQVKMELNSTLSTLEALEASVDPISSGLHSTGTALVGMSSTLGAVSFLGISLGEEADQLGSAGYSMLDAAENLDNADFGEQAGNFDDISESIDSVKMSITQQRLALAETKQSIQDLISLARIANVLLFFVIISMFTMISLNSAAGLIS